MEKLIQHLVDGLRGQATSNGKAISTKIVFIGTKKTGDDAQLFIF